MSVKKFPLLESVKLFGFNRGGSFSRGSCDNLLENTTGTSWTKEDFEAIRAFFPKLHGQGLLTFE